MNTSTLMKRLYYEFPRANSIKIIFLTLCKYQTPQCYKWQCFEDVRPRAYWRPRPSTCRELLRVKCRTLFLITVMGSTDTLTFQKVRLLSFITGIKCIVFYPQQLVTFLVCLFFHMTFERFGIFQMVSQCLGSKV